MSETEFERTERLITEALTAAGGWLDQKQIRKATGLPVSRVENFTLSMALEGKIGRTLTPDHRTQLFRAQGQAAYEESAEPGAFPVMGDPWAPGHGAS